MKINITDQLTKYVLSLTPDEEVPLLRYRKLPPRREGGAPQIVSPVLVICDQQKFQLDILEAPDLDERWGEGYRYEQETAVSKKKATEAEELLRAIGPFTLVLELTPEVFAAMLPVKEVLILMRLQNVPAFIKTKKVRVVYDKSAEAKDRKEGALPAPELHVKVERVRPIDELLRAHITEAAFYEFFIVGKSEEFYDAAKGELDDLVEIIGIKRKQDEGDTELKKRVKDYLTIRVTGGTSIKDADLQGLVRTAEDEAETQRKLDDAAKKIKKEKRKDT